ncbi:MAG TPA: hypothetical protein PLJ78_06640 [Anaerolineae bacterium]|nr:hypothetical protein [Anaerolineae bacterium]HQK13603.1 hypothetical protein [Anaerolineae bacterium]
MQQTEVQAGGLTAYTGFVREGHIQLAETVTLPEGSMVYVLVPVTVDAITARRKANRWLLEHVGVMLRADRPTFVRSATRPLWRFGAYVTAVSREPVGPVGYVEVDAINGMVLADARTAEEIAARGERLECLPFPPDN